MIQINLLLLNKLLNFINNTLKENKFGDYYKDSLFK